MEDFIGFVLKGFVTLNVMSLHDLTKSQACLLERSVPLLFEVVGKVCSCFNPCPAGSHIQNQPPLPAHLLKMTCPLLKIHIKSGIEATTLNPTCF